MWGELMVSDEKIAMGAGGRSIKESYHYTKAKGLFTNSPFVVIAIFIKRLT